MEKIMKKIQKNINKHELDGDIRACVKELNENYNLVYINDYLIKTGQELVLESIKDEISKNFFDQYSSLFKNKRTNEEFCLWMQFAKEVNLLPVYLKDVYEQYSIVDNIDYNILTEFVSARGVNCFGKEMFLQILYLFIQGKIQIQFFSHFLYKAIENSAYQMFPEVANETQNYSVKIDCWLPYVILNYYCKYEETKQFIISKYSKNIFNDAEQFVEKIKMSDKNAQKELIQTAAKLSTTLFKYFGFSFFKVFLSLGIDEDIIVKIMVEYVKDTKIIREQKELFPFSFAFYDTNLLELFLSFVSKTNQKRITKKVYEMLDVIIAGACRNNNTESAEKITVIINNFIKSSELIPTKVILNIVKLLIKNSNNPSTAIYMKILFKIADLSMSTNSIDFSKGQFSDACTLLCKYHYTNYKFSPDINCLLAAFSLHIMSDKKIQELCQIIHEYRNTLHRNSYFYNKEKSIKLWCRKSFYSKLHNEYGMYIISTFINVVVESGDVYKLIEDYKKYNDTRQTIYYQDILFPVFMNILEETITNNIKIEFTNSEYKQEYEQALANYESIKLASSIK